MRSTLVLLFTGCAGLALAGCAPSADGPPAIREGTIQALGPDDVIYLDDAIGSLAEETTSAGASRGNFTAYPYGVTRSDTTTAMRKYAGGPRDTSVDLDQMGARAYAPDLGVWTRVDPFRLVKPERGIRSSFAADHAYAYAALTPVVATDPDGLTVRFDPENDAAKNAAGFAAVQALTRDTLAVRAGAVVIQKEVASDEKSRGTDLVRRLVASTRTVTIVPFAGTGALNQSQTTARTPSAVFGGIPTGSTIGLDVRPLRLFTTDRDGIVRETDTPLSIVLGHELIHADRLAQGTVFSPSALTVLPFTFGAQPVLLPERVEELLVTGIRPAALLRAEFGTASPVTENDLRTEAGLPLRAAMIPAGIDPMKIPSAMPMP